MAIGSGINYSLAAVGTTVETFDKVQPGKYQQLIVHANGGNVPYAVTLRPVAVGSPFRALGVTVKFDPTIFDGPDDQTSGRVTVSINCNSLIGTVITEAELKDKILYALSVLANTNVLDALLAGSLE